MKKFEGYMRGINLGGWLSQCADYSEKHYSEFITESDIKTISEWGLDHVRLPIDYNVMFDSPKLQDRFISLWINIASRYGKNKNIAFELLNEIAGNDSSSMDVQEH